MKPLRALPVAGLKTMQFHRVPGSPGKSQTFSSFQVRGLPGEGDPGGQEEAKLVPKAPQSVETDGSPSPSEAILEGPLVREVS